jgi:DNA-binding NarL/FixJ family response regulator
METLNIKPNLKIIIAEDHPMMRDGLKLQLKKLKSPPKIELAENGMDVLQLLSKEHFDIVLMDVEMPIMDGIEATKRIINEYPKVKVIALTMYNSHRYIMELYDAGVHGYLLKNTTLKELVKAINLVCENEQYYCADVAEVLYKNLLKRDRITKVSEKEKVKITSREVEVVSLICDQYSSDEIAEKLFLSPKTVKRHRQILMEKTGSKNLAGLVLFAIKRGYYKVFID